MELKIGSNDQNTNGEVTPWQEWFKRYASSYAPPVDGYFGTPDEAAVRMLQARLGLVIDGVFGDRTAERVGYRWKNNQGGPVAQRRKIWIYTAPGSGANWDQGPSFQLGERCKNVLHINHQPLYYQKGGYLGFMGGDPKYSYNEVIWDQYLSLKYCMDTNPDWQDALAMRKQNPQAVVEVEGWFSGYSQSADGMEEAVERLFGDGGPYELLRDRINGIIQFGNPSTRNTGIARKVRPEWIYKLVTNLNYLNDFYAVAPDPIRPAFYKVIVEAEMELPFFVHVLQIAVPVILNIIPVFGGFFGPLGQLGVAAAAGIKDMNALGSLMGMAGTNKDQDVHQDLIEMLSLTGLIRNIPGLISVVSALPGLQAHGGYEFDPVMMNAAYDVVAAFRR
ncbi:lysin B [Mycobacterium phage JacoRen57]|nr:lysin B [Mycobacterium phage JacoRen57]